MREAAYRAYLSTRIAARSTDSYIAYGRRVEASLHIDLDALEPGELTVSNLRAELSRTRLGAEPKSLANCVTVVRDYLAFLGSGSAPQAAPRSAPTSVAGLEEPRPAIVLESGVRDLLLLHSQIIDELRLRGVVRTGSGPVGDYAELLFSRAFGWRL